MHWGVWAFCALKGSCKFWRQPSLPTSPPITSATETLGCTGHSTVALTRTHPHGWSGFYKCLGTNTLMRPFFKAADSSMVPWKNHHTSSLPSKILLLKLSKSKYCRISDCCWFPDSHCPSATQSKAYALYLCFQLCCPGSISMLCCTAKIFSVLSVSPWQGVQPSGLLLNRPKLWALRKQTQGGLFLTAVPKCFLSKWNCLGLLTRKVCL